MFCKVSPYYDGTGYFVRKSRGIFEVKGDVGINFMRGLKVMQLFRVTPRYLIVLAHAMNWPKIVRR